MSAAEFHDNADAMPPFGRPDSDAIPRDSGDSGDLPAAFWRPQPAKLRAYKAIYWLNRSLEAALLSLERLEYLGLFRLEYLNECKIRIEHARAEANQELTETLNQQEADDAGRFDRMQWEYEKRYLDPDDVFFAARNRRQEIKDQIRELQNGLARQRPQRPSRRAKITCNPPKPLPQPAA